MSFSLASGTENSLEELLMLGHCGQDQDLRLQSGSMHGIVFDVCNFR